MEGKSMFDRARDFAAENHDLTAVALCVAAVGVAALIRRRLT